jgi:hypothetical protein
MFKVDAGAVIADENLERSGAMMRFDTDHALGGSEGTAEGM